MSLSTLSGSTPTHRDYLGEWFTLLDTSGGRDKLARLLQYTAKFLKWYEENKTEEKQKNQQLITAYNNLYNGMAMVRHVMFLFWSIRIIRIIRMTAPSVLSSGDIAQYFSLAAKFGLLGYFTMDHLMFLQRLQFWKPEPKVATKVIGVALNGWLTELLCTTCEILIRLSRSTSIQNSTVKRETQITLIRLLARYAFDIPVALHFLQKLPDVPSGYFGLCGIGSTLLSIYDTWPSPPAISAVAVKKA